MSFLEHLEELRVRLVRMAVALCVGFGICWGFREQLFHFMVDPLRRGGLKVDLIYTGPADALMLYMKIAFFAGIFVAAPYILWEIWGFVSPGLYRNEKMYVIPFILFGSLFFVGGALFGHYFLFPSTFSFLGTFGGGDMVFMPKIDEYWSFYSWFLLGLGLVFQIPVIIFVLSRIGLVTPGFLLKGWKLAVVGAFVIAAFITPSPDMVNQTMLALPMLGLYALGVLVSYFFGRPRRDTPEPEVSVEPRNPD
jgi:sec-independent protein translocase protein TatC